MLYEHKTRSVLRCKPLESQDTILIQGKDIFMNYSGLITSVQMWDVPKNVTSISVKMAFVQVRVFLQAVILDNRNVVTLPKICKSCVTLSPICWYLIY